MPLMRKKTINHLVKHIIHYVAGQIDNLGNILQGFNGVFCLEERLVGWKLIHGSNNGGATSIHVSGVTGNLNLLFQDQPFLLGVILSLLMKLCHFIRDCHVRVIGIVVRKSQQCFFTVGVRQISV